MLIVLCCSTIIYTRIWWRTFIYAQVSTQMCVKQRIEKWVWRLFLDSWWNYIFFGKTNEFSCMHLEFLESFWFIVRLRACLCIPKYDSKFVGYILDKNLDFTGFSQTSWHLKNISMHKLYWYFYQLFMQIVFSTFRIWQLSQNISFILSTCCHWAERRYFENDIQKTFHVTFTSVLFRKGRWQCEPLLTDFSGHVFFPSPLCDWSCIFHLHLMERIFLWRGGWVLGALPLCTWVSPVLSDEEMLEVFQYQNDLKWSWIFP